ncbi:head-tail adaptor protein [Sphingomonas aliaeris]|uniref:Head-tail adaptor protein n=1 Tax=Sphingomonas aliaeris TaxID=2759526 RepID=A0A974S3Y7_9SPHN|nr:head-tail adaptor protein [Sphingomonas aliaeris]QQV76525.1 head-tail adaptor protein [Sphingomonas aliaeris]
MSVGKGRASRYNRRLAIEKPVPNTALTGAGSGTWTAVGGVWAEVQDVLPSRGERFDGGINLATRPARVRMNYRTDITTAMRFVMGSRIMQIISGPAEIGFKEEIEFMVEDFSLAGNGA